MASFDVLNEQGLIYEYAETYGFIADHLTSVPLDLSSGGPGDTYLSFYYQPGGLGDMPNEGDSLFLEFLSPSDTVWDRAWAAGGPETDSVPEFRHVMIHIDSLKYLDKGFRFRFMNLASISTSGDIPGIRTNCDHWHIDYVFLDTDRTLNDTVPHDVVISEPMQSILNNHEAMPWRHYKENIYNEMGGYIPIIYTNLDSITRNVTRDFQIWDVYDDMESHSYSAGAENISPWQTIEYNSNLLWNFGSSQQDSALFRIKAWLVTDDFDKKVNDTVVFYQHFANYFAYDDGIPEAGYGLAGEGSENMSVAYSFRSYIPDSLQAVNIFFNRSYLDENDSYFHLTVWNDNEGQPGDIIYSDENKKPKYRDSLNCFVTYPLDEKVPVDGIFYIGWQQTSKVFLNIGFDKNRNKNSKILVQKMGEWNMTIYEGALMMRPVVGGNILSSIPERSADIQFEIYPNPVSGMLKLRYVPVVRSTGQEVKIYDSWGRLVRYYEYLPAEIDVSFLSPGLYIFELKDASGICRKKFIKNS